jgi:hypothetical protein
MKLKGENGSTPGKTCPSATLSTTNPTWTDPGSNPGLRSGRPAANRLSSLWPEKHYHCCETVVLDSFYVCDLHHSRLTCAPVLLAFIYFDSRLDLIIPRFSQLS